ncbi:MAG: DUF2380 domain-containing protein, partial [Chloroflexi bacterium]|nr:DUF2380 domain-containing protein [Chloroflexota bacterium]
RAGQVGLASGAVAGAVTGALGPLLLPAAGTFLGSIIVSAELGGLGGALGRITSNLLTPCTPWYDGVPETVAVSIVIGGVLGGAGYGIRQWRTGRTVAPSTTNVPLLEPPKIQRHHIFPQKFRQSFESRGIYIDRHTVELSRGTHLSGVHGRGGYVGPGNVSLPGRWNPLWQAFKDANPNATAKEIY